MTRVLSIAARGGLLVLFFGAHLALAEEKPAKTATSTIAAALTREELELARYLEVLEDLDLYESWDFLELLNVLEDEDER
jgi:hypothetical protein